MKLAILGLGGVGRVIAKSAAKTGVYDEVTCADFDQDAVKSIISDISKNNFRGEIVDASQPEQVQKLAAWADVLINATIPRFNLIIMNACLENKCHYIDLACDALLDIPGKIHVREQLALDQKFREADLLALLGIGIDPGCSNIFARYLADRMDSVEEIFVRDADVSSVEGYDVALYFSPDTFIDECVSEVPVVFENGQFGVWEPLREIEEFVFPEPLGKLKVYAISHEEGWSIPYYLKDRGLKNCNFGYGLPEELITIFKALKILGLDSTEPIDVKGTKIVPRDVVTALLPNPSELAGKIKGDVIVGTLVRGLKDGKRVEKFMYNHISHEEAYRQMQEQGTSFQTGIPAALAADLLAEGIITERGAHYPEALNPEPFVKKLPDYGLTVKIEDRS